MQKVARIWYVSKRTKILVENLENSPDSNRRTVQALIGGNSKVAQWNIGKKEIFQATGGGF